jgi:hypothetical protein
VRTDHYIYCMANASNSPCILKKREYLSHYDLKSPTGIITKHDRVSGWHQDLLSAVTFLIRKFY